MVEKIMFVVCPCCHSLLGTLKVQISEQDADKVEESPQEELCAVCKEMVKHYDIVCLMIFATKPTELDTEYYLSDKHTHLFLPKKLYNDAFSKPDKNGIAYCKREIYLNFKDNIKRLNMELFEFIGILNMTIEAAMALRKCKNV